jgi:hypothetical protein
MWHASEAIHDEIVRADTFKVVNFKGGERLIIPRDAIKSYKFLFEKAAKTAAKVGRRMVDDLEERFNPNHDPDTGQFSSGGGSGGGTPSGDLGESDKKPSPGHGYSKEAYVDHGVIITDNVFDAVRALWENREVELDQPREVATLIDELGKVSARMIAAGKEAPNFDLCNVSVEGTNLFCAESKGIPRIRMPQLDDDATKKFLKHMKNDLGYRVEKGSEYADHLRATQNQLIGAKVAKVVQKLGEDHKRWKRRIVISKDNYILDGHHHWAGMIGVDAKNNRLGDLKVKVYRVNASITKLLKEAEKYSGAHAGTRGFDPGDAFVRYLFGDGEADAMDRSRCEEPHQGSRYASEAEGMGEDRELGTETV